MKKILMFLIVASIIFTACEGGVMYSNNSGDCPKYIMPDNITCYKLIKADYSGQIRFSDCDNSRTYISPEYYTLKSYLSNSSIC